MYTEGTKFKQLADFYVPLDEMLDTVSSTSSLKPKGDSQSRPSASARATSPLPRRRTTSPEMTSCWEPGSGGVRFGFFLRLGAVDLVVVVAAAAAAAACVATSGVVERGRLSDERTGACRDDAGLARVFCIIERIKSKP